MSSTSKPIAKLKKVAAMKSKHNDSRKAGNPIVTFEDLTKRFHSLSIKPTNPGFYDDKEFIEAEQKEPRILEAYAQYVDKQKYSSEYLEEARGIIVSASKYLSIALQKEGQMRACIDSSLTMARFLERKGVWCYIVRGALSIVFLPNLAVESQVLAPIMAKGNPATAGHVWVVAPPFKVIDLTAKLQPYSGRQSDFLPEVVLSESPKTLETFDPLNLFDTEAYQIFIENYRRKPSHDDIRRLYPGLHERTKLFGIHEVQTEHAKLTYIACNVTASIEPFEEADNLVLQGKKPLELFLEWDRQRVDRSGENNGKANEGS